MTDKGGDQELLVMRQAFGRGGGREIPVRRDRKDLEDMLDKETSNAGKERREREGRKERRERGGRKEMMDGKQSELVIEGDKVGKKVPFNSLLHWYEANAQVERSGHV